jgi:hypothetical protein
MTAKPTFNLSWWLLLSVEVQLASSTTASDLNDLCVLRQVYDDAGLDTHFGRLLCNKICLKPNSDNMET